ncbi:hypothetical protein J6590_019131 [Homalodisca vitripennis]|nr:hypothetical protein J6590_019131 [Homalodisca vitripennis]
MKRRPQWLPGEVMESRRRLQDSYILQRCGPPELKAYYTLLRGRHRNPIAEIVVNDESKHSTFSRINIVICFIPCGGPTVICFIPCGSRAADPLDGHRNVTGRYTFS